MHPSLVHDISYGRKDLMTIPGIANYLMFLVVFVLN